MPMPSILLGSLSLKDGEIFDQRNHDCFDSFT